MDHDGRRTSRGAARGRRSCLEVPAVVADAERVFTGRVGGDRLPATVARFVDSLDELRFKPVSRRRESELLVRHALTVSGCSRLSAAVWGEYGRKFSAGQAFPLLTALPLKVCKSIARASKVRILHLPRRVESAPDLRIRRSGACSCTRWGSPIAGGCLREGLHACGSWTVIPGLRCRGVTIRPVRLLSNILMARVLCDWSAHRARARGDQELGAAGS
jgi:hypothetical protein